MGHWGKFMDRKLIIAKLCLKNYLPKCSFMQPYRFILVLSWQWCICTKRFCKHNNIFLFIHQWVPRIKNDLLNLLLISFWFNFLTSKPRQRCTEHPMLSICKYIWPMTCPLPLTLYHKNFTGNYIWHTDRLWILATPELLKPAFPLPKSLSLTHGAW